MSNLQQYNSNKNPSYSIAITLIALIYIIFFSYNSAAQNSQVVQVKTFSTDLSPYPNISLSINKKDFVNLSEKGIVFINLSKSDIPIQSIKIKDETLEVASWNLSKGILEVMIRKKSYINKKIRVVDKNGNGIGGIKVQYSGNKTIEKETDNDGIVSFPLALNEEIKSVDQFKIQSYRIQDFKNLSTAIIVAQKIQPKIEELEPNNEDNTTTAKDQNYEVFLIIEKLDTITSIRALYDLMSQVPQGEFNYDIQSKFDSKFEDLLSQLNRGNLSDSNDLLNNISDTTIIQEDIDNLLKQARKENQSMSQKRLALESKIQLVRDKLNVGIENMTEDSKSKLLDDIEDLESILKNNKNEFNENVNTYLAVINELKRRFFDLKELESRLSESERERLKERKIYQQRLISISAVVLVFTFLIILLFYFRARLKKQQMALLEANTVVKLTNENLESLVLERTFLLHKTFKELDTVLYKASHDLRAPLSSIAGISDLINRETNNSELTGLLFKTNERMDKLLKKLSTVSEIHQPGEFGKIDINAISDTITNSFEPTVKERGINFKVNIEVPKAVVTIPKLVEVILYHLLENAFFFCWIDNEKPGKVALNIRIEDEKLEISVSDNGIGVEKNIQYKIFEMFYVGSDHSAGNGLGLYIVQKSAELLNGTVKVKSKQGQPTLFTVQLPTDGKGSNTLEFLGNLNA